jgi:hypothetical protein
MSYSGLAKALLLSVTLSACAHAAPTQTASSGAAPTAIETAGSRDTDGPRIKRLRSAFLAGESRPYESAGGDVIVEHQNCDVWTRSVGTQCDIQALANESMAPGTESSRW